MSYLQIKMHGGRDFFGVGSDTNIELASIKAVVSALNRGMEALGSEREEKVPESHGAKAS